MTHIQVRNGIGGERHLQTQTDCRVEQGRLGDEMLKKVWGLKEGLRLRTCPSFASYCGNILTSSLKVCTQNYGNGKCNYIDPEL